MRGHPGESTSIRTAGLSLGPFFGGTRGERLAEAVLVKEPALRHFCEQVFVKLGVPPGDARVTTDVLVLADLRGIESHGVARLPRYVTGIKEGFMKPVDRSRIVRATEGAGRLAAGLGPLAGPGGRGEPFVPDSAPSVVPRGKLEVLDRAGRPMPLGWAVDETGKGSTDPTKGLRGP